MNTAIVKSATPVAPFDPDAQISQMLKLTADLQELERLRALEQGAKFMLVVVPRAGAAELFEFATEEEWIGAIQQRIGQDVQVFPLTGYRWHVTRGPHRHLLGPLDQKIPLFGVSESDVDPSGWLSEPPDIIPSQPSDPVPPVVPGDRV